MDSEYISVQKEKQNASEKNEKGVNQTMKKLRIFLISFALILAMALAFAAGSSAAGSFPDVTSVWNWADDAIEYMVGKSVINGYTDGTFRPGNDVTRAEFVKMLNATFGLTAETATSYSDVKSDAWYYPHVRKAAAQGYLLSYGSQFNPDIKLTREEAASLLVRYLDLPEDEKASTSKFTDYTSINSTYRNYVLQAAEAGLFGGYEDGSFGPKRTLNRAEALTILYRAAGSVFNASSNGLDSGASDENAVVTKSGVTIRNATLYGRIIVSEGIGKYGRVTFDDCKIRGELIVRSGESVILTDCDVNEVTVTSETESTVYLEGDTVIELLTLEQKAGADIEKDAVIEEMVVNAAACGVSGNGELKELTVNAKDFQSKIMPKKYTIKSGLSATLAGTVYPQSATTGFIDTPTVSTVGSYEWLNGKSNVNGTLYWYYTNTAAAPASGEDYMTTYQSTASTVKSYFAVSKDGTINSQLLVNYNAMNYRYVAVMITTTAGHCTPVVIDRNAVASVVAGFSVAPRVTSNTGTGYDYLTGTPSVTGTIYYYYTNTAAAPASATEFVSNFNSIGASSSYALVGTISATTGSALNQSLKTTASVSAYNYVVMAIYYSNSTYTTPVVITRNAASTPTGSLFTITSSGTYDYLNGTPAKSGMVYYYYTTSVSAPATVADFWSGYNTNSYKGQISAYAGTAITNQQLKPVANVVGYNYVVVMQVPSDGTTMAPQLIARNGASAATTFTVTSSGTYDYLNGTPAKGGTIYYYYTNAYTTLTADSFWTGYSTATASYLGSVSAYAGSPLSNAYLKPTATVGGYAYVAVMLVPSDGTTIAPQLIVRNGGASTGTTFSAAPVFSMSNSTEYISATPLISGTLYWYYTTLSTVPTTGDAAFTAWVNSDSTLRGTDTTTAYSAKSFPLKSYGAVYQYSYIVAFIGYSNGVSTSYTTPVLITKSVSAATYNGFVVAPTLSKRNTFDCLNGTPANSGYVEYYYTNNPAKPSSTEFDTFYDMASVTVKGILYARVNVPLGGSSLCSDTAVGSYTYVVIRLKDTTGVMKYDPVVLARASASVSGTGFSFGPTYALHNPATDSVNFTPSITGTLYWYYTTLSSAPTATDYSGLHGAAPLKGSQPISVAMVSQPAYMKTASERVGYSYVVLQIVDASGNRYTPVILSVNTVPTHSGFLSGPSWTSDDGYDRVSGVATTTGKLWYYYTNSNVTPTVDTFLLDYEASTYKAQPTISAQSFDVSLLASNNVASYNYVVVMLEDTNGTKYLPVVLNRITTVAGHGFTTGAGVDPFTFLSNDGEGSIYLQATPAIAGKLSYYLTDSTTVTNFDTGYAGAAIKDILSVTPTLQRPKLGTSTTLAPYTHVVVRLQHETTYYQHLVIALPTA